MMNDLVQMTIIDRLCEAKPFASIKEMREMVRRDLEDLLNTRQGRSDIASWFPELEKSIATYGLNNIDTVDMSSGEELEELLSDIKCTIQMFEPRLEHIEVVSESHAISENGYTSPFVLRLRINADMRVGENVESVVFNTMIQKSGATVQEAAPDA
jgi:type VI secretion system protein ImpF